jgi:hypothetical protein
MQDQPQNVGLGGQDDALVRAGSERHGWWVHGASLVVIAVFFLVITWDAWMVPRGLDPLGAVFLAMALFVHAAVSTIVVALARRHRMAAAIIVHGLVLSAVAIGHYVELQDKARRARIEQEGGLR